MSINFSKKTFKDTFYSFLPVNWLLRSAALSYTYRKGTNITTSTSIIKSTIYIIVFGSLNMLCFYHKVTKFRENTDTSIVRFSDVIQLTYLYAYFVYVLDVYFVCKYDKDKILRYFETYDRIDSILGIPPYNKIRKSIIESIALSIAVFICICIFDYVCWVQVDGWVTPLLFAVDYFYLFLNLLTVLDVISHVLQVENRLKIIGDLLQKNVQECDVSNENDVRIKMPEYFSSYPNTTWFSRCYLLLLEQVSYVNTNYGFRVMTQCVNVLFNMINFLNLAIRVVNGTLISVSVSRLVSILPTVASILRAFNYEFMVIILMYRCEKAYKQSERILETIDTMMTINKNCNVNEQFLEFRNLLITRPIKFHAANFFTMNYTLLVSLNSAVVTYTIIMLQNIQ